MFSANSSQVSEDRLYVEDVFSTYLYTGNGSTQTITNGIDLAGKGGLVWIKARSSAQNNVLADTANGTSLWLSSNTTDGQSGGSVVTSFSSTGFNTGGNTNYVAGNGVTYASWTFRKAPKFFDVVTYTGNGNASQTISHNLGVEPGCIIVKRLNATSDWSVYHRGNPSPNSSVLALNTTAAKSTYGSIAIWNPTATTFTADRDYGNTNSGGGTYVAYLFAHDTTSDGIIQCGSYTGNGSATGPEINLGWEAQWVLIKRATGGTASWVLVDNMRGMSVTSSNYLLYPNSTGADNGPVDWVQATATGFQIRNVTGTDFNNSGDTYIYIAIRRGPMRTPTSGTSVFAATATAAASGTTITTNFPVDLNTVFYRDGADSANTTFMDRLRGLPQNSSDTTSGKVIRTSSTAAEITNTSPWFYTFDNTGWKIGGGGGLNYLYYSFRRAPSFFDEVCYTGTGVARTVNHNLGVAPELVIIKSRSFATNWNVLLAASQQRAILNSTNAASSAGGVYWGDGTNYIAPTSTQMSLAPGASQGLSVNWSGDTYVAYLFASCPGVSKIGTYTGNGSSQTINCGFAAGARFVMIKRTDSTGDWYVWDTARGIVAGNDPHLSLNTTAAEVTTDDSVDTDSSGFVVNQLSATNINVSSAQYIYMAVA